MPHPYSFSEGNVAANGMLQFEQMYFYSHNRCSFQNYKFEWSIDKVTSEQGDPRLGGQDYYDHIIEAQCQTLPCKPISLAIFALVFLLVIKAWLRWLGATVVTSTTYALLIQSPSTYIDSFPFPRLESSPPLNWNICNGQLWVHWGWVFVIMNPKVDWRVLLCKNGTKVDMGRTQYSVPFYM